MPTAPKQLVHFLQYFPAVGTMCRINLDPLPFRVGRAGRANFVMPSVQISKDHAEFYCSDHRLHIRDLGSTNGTLVNGQRVSAAPLTSGDIIHLAHEEFRYNLSGLQPSPGSDSLCDFPLTEQVHGSVPPSVVLGRERLKEMVQKQSVRMLFQPVVDLYTGAAIGAEALARGTHTALSIRPNDLFKLAERCGLAALLSQLFRKAALLDSARLGGGGYLFLNLHPAELTDGMLLPSLRSLEESRPQNWQLVLEIHEEAAADLRTWQKLRGQVQELGMRIAYDDFGAGRARLLELADAPPDFIKLDMRLIRDLQRDQSRQQVIAALVQASSQLGVKVIAEGVETEAEWQICYALGCHYGQGYLFGYPASSLNDTVEAKVVETDGRLPDAG